jgi:hypothetical protein
MMIIFLWIWMACKIAGIEGIGSIRVLQTAETIFEQEAILELKIKGPVNKLIRDRSDQAVNQDMILSYVSQEGEQEIPIKMKTRGNFRRQAGNCTYPPLLVDFNGKDLSGSPFVGMKAIKLVMPCRGEDYIIREYLAYKLYNLFTPRSYKARLVLVSFEDPSNTKKGFTIKGILLEEDEAVAKRNQATLITKKMVRPENTQTKDFIRMALYEYMIGNTDWSVQYLHNVRLLGFSGEKPVPVPYDFDHSGLVHAPYAKPSEALQMNSVMERRYRGYCLTDYTLVKEFFTEFLSKKEQIQTLVNQQPWIDHSSPKEINNFLNEFFDLIQNEKKWKDDLSYPCLKEGTGNVVIKGLKG